ncbi:MAG: fibronectin type III domain-containing protein, partial [Clostridia bacterium]|nr:fibronectin type III domain-containing protein [Clostridia bacterium]
MKKLFAALVALALFFAACAMAEEFQISCEYEYNVLSDGTAEITGYNGNAETLDIPSVIDGYVVSGISSFAFNACYLTSVTIPEGVTRIG